MTIKEILDSYIESKEGILSPNTLIHLKAIRDTRYSRLKPLRFSAIKNWQKEIMAEMDGLSPRTMTIYWSALSNAIKSVGLPVPSVVLPKTQYAPKPYLTPDEIPIFMAAIRGHKHEISMLFGLHGLRPGETSALRWEDMDFKKHSFRVEGTVYHSDEGWIRKDSTKTEGSRRTVPFLIPRLEDLISKADKSLPFPVTHPDNLYSAVNNICKKNGLPEIGGHGLRRSFSSLAYSMRIPERVLMDLGGWSSYMTVHRHYIQISKADVDRYSDDFRQFFSQKKDGTT